MSQSNTVVVATPAAIRAQIRKLDQIELRGKLSLEQAELRNELLAHLDEATEGHATGHEVREVVVLQTPVKDDVAIVAALENLGRCLTNEEETRALEALERMELRQKQAAEAEVAKKAAFEAAAKEAEVKTIAAIKEVEANIAAKRTEARARERALSEKAIAERAATWDKALTWLAQNRPEGFRVVKDAPSVMEVGAEYELYSIRAKVGALIDDQEVPSWVKRAGVGPLMDQVCGALIGLVVARKQQQAERENARASRPCQLGKKLRWNGVAGAFGTRPASR